MKRQAADRLNPLHRSALLVGLCAAVLLFVVGGCGEMNDNPQPGGLTVHYGFADDIATATGAGGTSSPQAIYGDERDGVSGPAVKTVVVGAIVVTHVRTGCSTICAYTDPDQVAGDDKDKLEDDAKQSIQYLSVIQLPQDSDTVEFAIPPKNAGNWQLIGVGLINKREGIDDIDFETDPLWYGFLPRFLNNQVTADSVVDDTLTLSPWCSGSTAQTPPCPASSTAAR